MNKLYEAMFLMDVQTSPDLGAMDAEIRRILGRAEVEILVCRRWEDRRLAYEINGRKRGSYWLTYFHAMPDKIAAIERDVQLSEKVLRLLVVRVEQVPTEELAPTAAADQPAAVAVAPEAALLAPGPAQAPEVPAEDVPPPAPA